MALYALLDFDTLQKYNISIKDFCKTSKGLKAKILQYRDKNSSIEEKLKRIKEIKKYWKKTLIINDTIELLPYADGIHIGQEDLENLCKRHNLTPFELINAIRNGYPLPTQNSTLKTQHSSLNTQNSTLNTHHSKLKTQNSTLITQNLKLKTKIVGLSTHNKEEIIKANKLPLNYIGLGAYRPTSTKETSNILGKKIIDLIKYSYHPVAIIGGVKIYDKIPAKFKVVGSDICKLMSIQSKKKRILVKK